ncbi:MAG: DUF3298 domain-containing protein [Oscillospiraceae bacterium]|nr:DUF3298 domain-containing protein [Oscillospiraceae bacterium]
MKNRTIALILTLAAAFSLCACALEKTEPAAEKPGETASEPIVGRPDVPQPTAEEPPAAGSGGIVVSLGIESGSEYGEDGETVLLEYSAMLARVRMDGAPEAEARINAVLEADFRQFLDGDGSEGLSGREGFLAAAAEDLALRRAYSEADWFTPFYMHREVSVKRGDRRVLSLAYAESYYTGGVHGSYGVSALNFDPATGEQISLQDLADDPAAFLTACEDMLWEVSRSGENTAMAMGGYYDDYEQYLPGLLRDGNWFFDDRGLTVIANPYEIAPYASGLILLTLPYEWLRAQIREEYLPVSRADGVLEGRIDEGGVSQYMAEDGAHQLVFLKARGRVENVELFHAEYSDYNNTFWEKDMFWFADRIEDGETLCLQTDIPEIIPDVMLRYTGSGGTREYLISQSGKDGSLVLMDRQDFAALPMEISARLPFRYDLDGDGDRETIDLLNTAADGMEHWRLLVDGELAPDALDVDASLLSLYLTDLDSDGTAEILFSGNMGSDDYVTCAWRGDTLAPIPFTGESRGGADPSRRTSRADGRAVVSGSVVFLESWSYQLGTYAAVRAYTVKDGVITPQEDMWGGFDGWRYLRNRQWLTLKKALSVTLEDGTQTLLPVGERLLLTGTDGADVLFRSDSGQRGTIRVLRPASGNRGGWVIDGIPEEEYFAFLPYAG